MLVLSRKIGESIMIGDQIEVKIVSIDGENVRLGISAPKSVQIFRSEIFDMIQNENKEALQISSDFIKNIKKIK